MRKFKAKKKEGQEQETRLLITTVIREALDKDLVSQEQLKNSNAETIGKFNAETSAMNNKLDKLIKRQDKSEEGRIKMEIIAAADLIRSGHRMSEARYLAVSDAYAYYADVLKKNSYIKEEFKFIQEEMRKQRNSKRK